MDKIKCKSYLETSKFKIQICRPRGCQEPDTQVASLGCTHYFPALAFLWLILASLIHTGQIVLSGVISYNTPARSQIIMKITMIRVYICKFLVRHYV